MKKLLKFNILIFNQVLQSANLYRYRIRLHWSSSYSFVFYRHIFCYIFSTSLKLVQKTPHGCVAILAKDTREQTVLISRKTYLLYVYTKSYNTFLRVSKFNYRTFISRYKLICFTNTDRMHSQWDLHAFYTQTVLPRSHF